MKENNTARNFEPNECVIFVQSMKIGTHENKAIHCYMYKNNSPHLNILEL